MHITAQAAVSGLHFVLNSKVYILYNLYYPLMPISFILIISIVSNFYLVLIK